MLVFGSYFFFNDTATTELYTLSLHDALPIYRLGPDGRRGRAPDRRRLAEVPEQGGALPRRSRSEEHTSELQSHVNLVCRLLLEKKKKKDNTRTVHSRNVTQRYDQEKAQSLRN